MVKNQKGTAGPVQPWRGGQECVEEVAHRSTGPGVCDVAGTVLLELILVVVVYRYQLVAIGPLFSSPGRVRASISIIDLADEPGRMRPLSRTNAKTRPSPPEVPMEPDECGRMSAAD